jgi:oligosaccharide amylase
MAKSLVLGNGSILACFDTWGQLSDFYFPHVGQENHVGHGHRHRIGIWCDDHLHWVDNGQWESTVRYESETAVSDITLFHPGLQLRLHFTDAVYNEKNILVRRVSVTDESGSERHIKIFFNQQFKIGESPRGDTAYFDGREHAIVHFKGRRVFVVSAWSGTDFFDDYSVGLLGIEGKEGTWRDAEDGILSKSGVEHGSVDSVIALPLIVPARGTVNAWQWISASTTYREAIVLHRDVITRSPDHLLQTTGDYWRAWISKRPFTFYGLDDSVVELFKKSLLVIRGHYDHGGGIIASSDSDILQYGRDTYAYVWPRDAAYIALALDKAGYDDISERFFHFCADAITDDGYLLHKYLPDGSLGSSWHPWVHEGKARLPIQEDETAIVLVTLWKHYQISRNLEFVEKIYNDLIKRAADFMVRHRDRSTGLPLPSYDLWEEQWGISCYTACCTIGGLLAAAQFAEMLGKHVAVKRYRDTAAAMTEAVLKHFYSAEHGWFAKMVHVSEQGVVTRDMTVDSSSAWGLFHFGVLPPNDPRLERAFAVAEEKLSGAPHIGGIARYEHDQYYKRNDSFTGNPWFIPTFWHIEYAIAKAKNETELEPVKEKLRWAVDWAVGAGMLAEQIDPATGAPLSVCPLTWSHAAYVLAVIAYLERLEELGICPSCYPINN